MFFFHFCFFFFVVIINIAITNARRVASLLCGLVLEKKKGNANNANTNDQVHYEYHPTSTTRTTANRNNNNNQPFCGHYSLLRRTHIDSSNINVLTSRVLIQYTTVYACISIIIHRYKLH